MKDLLTEIDKVLAQIEVKGDSVLSMANARSLLKKAYDMCVNETNSTNK